MLGKSLVKRIIGFLFVLVVVLAVGFVSDCLSKLNHHRNQLNFQIANSDRELARAELDNVKYFDELARKWKMDWFAGSYLISDNDVVLYDMIVDDLLIGDYKKVADSERLKASDDYRAAHFVGVVKVRLLQAEYREEKNPAAKKKLLDKLAEQMVEDVSPHFKKAVENSPEFGFPDPNFDDRWNYDMTSNKDDAKKLIENKQPAQKFILGVPQLPDGDEPGGKKPVDGKRLNEETKPGAGGNPKKKG